MQIGRLAAQRDGHPYAAVRQKACSRANMNCHCLPDLLEGLDTTKATYLDWCILACRRFPRPEVTQKVAEKLEGIGDNNAVATLKAFGPIAEDAVLPYLDHANLTAQKACNVLAEIGTSKSLPKLAPLVEHQSPTLRAAASRAVARIHERRDATP